MKLILAAALACIGAGQVALAADPPTTRLVHRYLSVEISPDGQFVASVEGDSSRSGGAPTIRDLVIRQARTGTAITVAMPCGRIPQCWPGSPSFSPDGKHLSFALSSARARIVLNGITMRHSCRA
ncbi:MAG: hypothetical protein ACLPWG_21090 [Steroidobacteraceae bacterium]